MKLPHNIFILTVYLLLACGPSAEEKAAMENCRLEEIRRAEKITTSTKHYFDAECPGRNRKLSNFIGDTLIIEDVCGGLKWPLELKITSTSKTNTITNINSGQVIFSGKVCKHQDRFYFSERLNDTLYRIFTMQFSENAVYGIPAYYQFKQIDSLLKTGLYNNVLAKGSPFKIHATKRNIRKIFEPLSASLTSRQLISPITYSENKNTTESDLDNEPIDENLISNVYPNPVRDILNIELLKPDQHNYVLIDINGKTVLTGTLNNRSNKIEMGHLNAGMYSLIIQHASTQQTETIKVVKQN